MDSMNPWHEYQDAFSELQRAAAALGLRVVVDPDIYFTDAQLFHGDEPVCWVHFDPNEGLWAAESQYRFFADLGDIMVRVEDLVSVLPDTRRRQVLEIEYQGDAPALSAATLKAVKKLLPGKPTSVKVR